MKLKSYILLGFAALAMTACNEDFNDGIVQQGINKQPATVSFGNGSVTEVALIDFATLPADLGSSDSVQVCKITAPTSTYESTSSKYVLTLNGGTANAIDLALDNEGRVLASELRSYVEKVYGMNPKNINNMTATVTAYTGDGNTAVKQVLATSGTFNVQVKVLAPNIEPKYYFTGTLNGWDNGNTDYVLTNDGTDPYDNPTFTMRLPAPADGGDIDFKMTPESKIGTGDWSECLAGNGEGLFAYQNGGDGSNLKIAAVEGAVGYKVTFKMLELTYSAEAIFSTPETWYLVGSCIGDGSWGNNSLDNVGVSLFPLARTGSSTISYTGYFTTDGFKLIKTPGSWNDQWGQGVNGYVKNDGGSGNITVPSAGYYTVTLDYINDKLTIEPVDITPKTYEVGMAGSFNGWSFQAMTKCPNNDHLWKAELSADEAKEAKFLIDGWSVNWGSKDFPSGIGTQGGDNIPVERGSYIVIFNDITGGYNFIRTDAEPEPAPVPETWYLVGSCIGDGTWSNSSVDNVGVSLFPLAYAEGTIITYTGYLTTAGFKLIKTPGSWDDQWGQGASGYVKNDGGSGNIIVPSDGYYRVTLDYKNDELTITQLDITPETYAVGVAGSFNSWSFQAIEQCVGNEHLWRAEMTFDDAAELKFLVDGWATNWGGADFPTGLGLLNGPNIPVKAGSYIVVFNDITGGYNFVSK